MRQFKQLELIALGSLVGALVGGILAIGIVYLVPVPKMYALDNLIIFVSCMVMVGVFLGTLVAVYANQGNQGDPFPVTPGPAQVNTTEPTP